MSLSISRLNIYQSRHERVFYCVPIADYSALLLQLAVCGLCLNVAEGIACCKLPARRPATSPSLSWSTSFRSASELATALLRLGKSFDVLQLSAGPLQGHFSVVHLKDLSILSIQTNQLLLLNGERGTDSITFSLETSGNFDDHRIFSRAIDPHSLHGFKPDLKESHFQLTAGSTTVIAITSAKKFCSFLECYGELELLENLYTSNSRWGTR